MRCLAQPRTETQGSAEMEEMMRQHIRIHKAEPNKGILDYSHLLDAPAGKHGFVEAKTGICILRMGSGQDSLDLMWRHVPIRRITRLPINGGTFCQYGSEPDPSSCADAPVGEEAGSWSSCKEAPLLDYAGGNSRKFNPEGLDRFDYFAAKLKEKGIYLHIDLIVAREFQPGDEMDYPGARRPVSSATPCTMNA